MKAKLEANESETQYILTLEPEGEHEIQVLKDFGQKTSRTWIFTGRGFKYLSPELEFIISPYTRDY